MLSDFIKINVFVIDDGENERSVDASDSQTAGKLRTLLAILIASNRLFAYLFG